MRRCLHDTGESSIPVRLHAGSTLSIYIRLHDTGSSFIPVRLHPGSTPSIYIVYMVLDRVSFGYDFILVPYRVSIFVYMIPTKISFRNESFHIPVVAPDRNFRSRMKYIRTFHNWFIPYFWSGDAFIPLSFQNENFCLNVNQLCNSFRYHVNTTLICGLKMRSSNLD